MSGKCHAHWFTLMAPRVTDQGYPVKAVAKPSGLTAHSLNVWITRFTPISQARDEDN